jgi:ribosomal protein S18 acetylase RimI-like enzyme
MSDKRLTLTLEERPSPEAVGFLVHHMLAFNEAHRPHAMPSTLAAFVRDGRRRVVGGALGSTHWGWLHVSHLWVPEELRRQGWGRRLMEALEAGARERECHSAHVDTFGFQARGFYERLGYQLFGTLPDYPQGESLYFLFKRLSPLPSSTS